MEVLEVGDLLAMIKLDYYALTISKKKDKNRNPRSGSFTTADYVEFSRENFFENHQKMSD